MASKLTSTYELTELTPAYAIIKGNSKIETLDKEAYMEANGMKMKYDLTGDMISLITTDRTTGWIVNGTINQEINGDAIILENPQLPEGMIIPMKIFNEMKVTDQ
jgi:hypothetical protein